MLEIISKLYVIAIFIVSAIVASTVDIAQSDGFIALSILFSYAIFKLFQLTSAVPAAKTSLHILINSFNESFDTVLNIGIAVVAILLFYHHGSHYQLALLFWLIFQLGVYLTQKIVVLNESVPFSFFSSWKGIKKDGGFVACLSERYFTESNWHTFALYFYLYLPDWFYIYIGTSFIVITPFMCKIFQEGMGLIRHVRGIKRKELVRNIRTEDPEVLFYCAGTKGSVYQLNQWVPVLERCNKRVLVVVREEHYFDGLVATSLPIVYVRSMSSIDLILTESTRAVLYPANGVKNAHMLRWSELTHIFVNHGESDKIVNVSKFLRSYDRLYVAGQMAVDRTLDAGLGILEQNLVPVGRPQTELKLSVAGNDKIGEKITVLYAPTWEGFAEAADYTSISKESLHAFTSLLNDPHIEVIFKPHPFTGITRSELRPVLAKFNSLFNASANARSYGSDTDIHQLMNESDVLITDVSSVLNDYLYTEKPIIISNPFDISVDQFHHLFSSSRAAYVLRDDMSNMGDLLSEIVSADPLRDKRLETKRNSLGDWPQGALQRFDEQLALDCE